jgi:NAD(P)-dependent dehydrogenase (short-subunit alcohol dehydrogenase family)
MPNITEDRFAGKIAFVTGGSSGLGRAMALRLAAEGASVAIGDLREDPREGGDPTHKVIAEGGGQAMHHSFDVTDEEAVEQAVAATVGEFGGLDVVICAAGVMGPDGDSLAIPFDEIENVYRVNVFGTWLCNQAVLRRFVPARSGKIVNMASNYGIVGAAGLAGYCGSKAAVIGMTKSLAAEFGQYGININALCPGAAVTELNAHMREREEIDELLREGTPLRVGKEGRYVAEPAEIASAALYLASDEFSFGTGTAFVVDGGWVAQ